MTREGWIDRGFDRDGALRIERGPWVIVRTGPASYTLYRGAEMHGIYPDAHEAAMHADMVEAGQP